jgi:acetyl-CoA carboxylase biotin carboxyl carrier protein
MNDQDKTEPTGVAPAREPQREGFSQQSEQQRAASLNSVGGRRNPRRRHRDREGQPQQTSHARPEASLNMDELRELFDLISAQGFTEFELEKEGFRVRLRRDFSTHDLSGAQISSHSAAQPSQPAHSASSVSPQSAHATTGSAPSPATHAQSPADSSAETVAASPKVELYDITSPIVGTFYRSPSPASEPFVKVGSHVDPDTVVCIVEAMKLMNEILAEAKGTIEMIYVENGQPVEFGQPLFGIRK